MQKTVIVTGASSGIGAAIAILFGNNGYNVVVAGRNAEKCHTTANQIPHATVWTGNITESENCSNLVEHSIQTFGNIDALVNSAGIIYRQDSQGTTDQMWRDTIATNLDAPFFLSRKAIPHLLKTKGSIINIASDWGLVGGKDAAAYCASKGGLVLLTKSIGLELAKSGVNVNAICPGDVDTPMLIDEASQRGVDYELAMAQNHADSPTGRVTKSEEIAALALYLASDVAKQITGTAISIDGGNTA